MSMQPLRNPYCTSLGYETVTFLGFDGLQEQMLA